MMMSTVVIDDTADIESFLADSFSIKDLKILTMKVTRMDDTSLKIKLNVAFPENFTYQDVINLIKANPQIRSVDI